MAAIAGTASMFNGANSRAAIRAPDREDSRPFATNRSATPTRSIGTAAAMIPNNIPTQAAPAEESARVPWCSRLPPPKTAPAMLVPTSPDPSNRWATMIHGGVFVILGE